MTQFGWQGKPPYICGPVGHTGDGKGGPDTRFQCFVRIERGIALFGGIKCFRYPKDIFLYKK